VFTRHREIWYALAAVVLVTALYALAYLQAGAFPRASGLVGHGIGVVGFLLILATETLYSLRKRRMDASWGSMAAWLRFHVFTGLVGPYMVLLHTSMRFQGLAGVAMLLTGVVVVSGVVGRYIYTSVPRTLELASPSPDFAAVTVDAPLAGAVAAPSGAVPEPTTAADPSAVPDAVASDDRMRHLETRRRALATWYSVHVPLTWALLVAAAVHMAGALYYATLQR
jgi:hypothetical protein